MRKLSHHRQRKQNIAYRLARSRSSLESLESRTMLYSGPTLSNGMPDLHSLPGAPSALFLDFDGHANRDYAEPWSLDGNDNNFNAEEQDIIYESWRRTAMYFSMFNINVTTVEPASGIAKAWLTMSPTYPGDGIATVNTFPSNGPTGYVPEKNFLARTAAHEAGHIFGARHAASYDNNGDETAEYADPLDPLHGHIMGGGGGLGKWTAWHRSNSGPTVLLDSMEVIRADLDAQDGSGDGFRADGANTNNANATTLTIGTPTTDYIERVGDIDVFKFTIASAGRYTVSAGRVSPSPVDLDVWIKTSGGTLLASEDGDQRAQPVTMVNDHSFSLDLSAGTYYVSVAGHGNQSDQGQYTVRVDPIAAGWSSADVSTNTWPGHENYDAGTDTWNVSGSGYTIWYEGDGFHYVYQQLLGDGSITAKVNSINGPSDYSIAGVMMRETLAEGSKHVAAVTTVHDGSSLIYRSSTDGNAAGTRINGGTAFSAKWMRVTRTGNTVGAYYSVNSTNGVDGTWTQIGTNKTVTMGSSTVPVYVGLVVSAGDENGLERQGITNASFYKAVTTGTIYTGPTISGTAVTPASLTVSSPTANSLSLSWTNVSGETGYSIERSSDGVLFSEIATRGTNQTTYTDTNLSDNSRYFYRVRSINASGMSNPSPIKTNYTKAGAISNLNLISDTASNIVLNWTDASGEDSYEIQRSNNGTSGWTTLDTIDRNVPIYNDNTVSPSTRYYYRVRTIQGGSVTATSAVADTYSTPSTPNPSFTTIASNQLAFSWSAVSGATGYWIERWSAADGLEVLATNHQSTSYSDTTVSPLTDYHYVVYALNSSTQSDPAEIFAATPATTSLPSGWSSADIGSVGGQGAAGYASGTFTVLGSGDNIWGTADSARFVYTTLSSTNGWIQARVASQEEDGAFSLAGVMIRESTAAGAKNATLWISPEQESTFSRRSSTNGSSSGVTDAILDAPYWLRLERSGSTFTAKVSANGSSWSTVGSTTISMTTSTLIGLFVCSNDNGAIDHATFDNVSTSFGGTLNSMQSLQSRWRPVSQDLFSSNAIESEETTLIDVI